jgi:malonate decarboxylase acyl carrier protein
VALEEFVFEFCPKDFVVPEGEWSHAGVVGSGDLEILMEKTELGGKAMVKVTTPAHGYERVWQVVLERFINRCRAGNVSIEINDNYATPLVVSTRLSQALENLNSFKAIG